MTAATPLVSVVTPVYNSVDSIEECVRSVLAQTYANFEYIVVDNCSTDGTPEVVAAFAEQDSRIRLLRPEAFVGPDPNANRALGAIALGSAYTKVVHGDDWLFPECLERMVDIAVRHPSVGVVGAYRLEGTRVTLDGLPKDVELVPGREACRNHLLGGRWGYLFGSPSSVMYRSDLVRARPEFYPLDNPFQSDQEACLLLLLESDLGFVHQVLTFTRRHEGADSSFYVRVGAEAPGQLKLLVEYGPGLLEASEYRRRLAARVLLYVLNLAKHPRRLADPEIRAYHATVRREMAGSVAPLDLVRGVVDAVRKRVLR
ncbi:MAG TPA: glycosyltransferase family 2 protein [Gaiellaceae bacterium]